MAIFETQFSLATSKPNSHWQYQKPSSRWQYQKPNPHWQYLKPNFHWDYFIEKPEVINTWQREKYHGIIIALVLLWQKTMTIVL